jgi:hypothetical protein
LLIAVRSSGRAERRRAVNLWSWTCGYTITFPAVFIGRSHRQARAGIESWALRPNAFLSERRRSLVELPKVLGVRFGKPYEPVEIPALGSQDKRKKFGNFD